MTEQTTERPRLTLVDGEAKPESATAKAARERQERFEARQAEKARLAAAAQERLRELEEIKERRAQDRRPRIRLDTDPQSIRDLARSINARILPDTYVRTGEVVVVEEPSGALVEDDEPAQVINIVKPATLNRLLAENTFTYEVKKETLPDGSKVPVEVETTPSKQVSEAVLDGSRWNGLPVLHSIATAPLFRPDGTLVQKPGYDEATRMIYAPKLSIPHVPDNPSPELIEASKAFILDKLLANFPWVGPSRTNYIGILVAQLLRHYLGEVPVPLLAVDATSPATGKSLLAKILIKLFSGYERPWVGDEDELRKVVTSILKEKGGSIISLDNVGRGEVVDQATLAAMLTATVWSDRLLSTSDQVTVRNDRIWVVTGNSLSIGGDIASRAVLVRLDAQIPNPELRPASAFVLGDLEEWLLKPDNRARVMFYLLVLVRAWIVAGAPRVETPMRSFTPWASATAGFLKWLGEPGFMTNRSDLVAVDEEEGQYAAFYARWYELFGDQRMTAKQLHDSALPDDGTKWSADRKEWRGTFLVRKRDGHIMSAVGLGQALASERGRFRGGYRLNGFRDSHTEIWSYSVTPHTEPIPEGAR